MRIQATVAMMMAMAANGWSGEKIRVYIAGGNISSAVLSGAENTASRMFATAGVQIAWRFGAPPPAESAGEQPAIAVDFPEHPAPNDHPGAMAYARPYEGIHIVVLYDRMQKVQGRLRPVLLGHVLAHELAHVLEGVPHHSATGVMKAHWDLNDYNHMLVAPLAFEAEDLDMIQRGIQAREARTRSGSIAAAETREPDLRLTVRLMNYVNLPVNTRRKLVENAGHVLGQAGIAIDFVECGNGGVATGDPRCNRTLGPRDLVLRILDPKFRWKGEELGYAAAGPEGGAYITVFLNPRQPEARATDLSDGALLGHAVAHEIGHLLLGANAHSSYGIRPVWRRRDENSIAIGHLLFDGEQARRMHVALMTRQ